MKRILLLVEEKNIESDVLKKVIQLIQRSWSEMQSWSTSNSEDWNFTTELFIELHDFPWPE